MIINKERFLNDLQMVKGGLSAREFTEQSSCFVFKDGEVMTFNDEVACRKKIQSETLTGAVPAARLLEILDKISDPELKVRMTDGELQFRGKRKGFAVTKEKEISLPIDQVERPKKWITLPENFTAALGRVKRCVSRDDTKFILTCVHFHPNFIEACDNKQLLRYNVQLGLSEPILVRAAALGEITSLSMDDVSITESWVHFRKKVEDESSLIFSCRKYLEPFPDMSPVLDVKGRKIVIPRGLQEATERAGIFASDKSLGSAGDPSVVVNLTAGRLLIRGEGLAGWYQERKKIAYEGPELSFCINPVLLKDIAESYTNARVSENVLKVTGGRDIKDGGKWEYIARLGSIDEKEEEDDQTEEKPAPKKKKLQ